MTDLVINSQDIIERILTLELVRVTERAAVASARLRGRGDEKAADQAAVDAERSISRSKSPARTSSSLPLRHCPVPSRTSGAGCLR